MNYVLRKLDGAVGLAETAVVRTLRVKHRYPPLFVVGAPRSGTTVVIQHIINTLRLGYFPNVARRHENAPITFTWFAARRHRFEPSYDSEYGLIDGPMAPSDGWEVFHRWFPRYDYREPVREDRLHELRTIVALLEKIFRAPIANKNNSNSVRIPHLDAVFPDALFVNVSRDLCDTVASVMKGRVKHAIPDDEWWGAAPPRFVDRSFDSVLERVVHQVWDVRRYVDECLGGIDARRRLAISYEDFCARPGAVIEWIEAAYRDEGVTVDRRPRGPAEIRPPARAPERASIEAEVARIVEGLERDVPVNGEDR